MALVAVEVFEMRKEYQKRGSLWGYFHNLGNILDFTNYTIQFAMIIVWITYVGMCDRIKEVTEVRFDIYEDAFAVGRYFKPNDQQLTKALKAYNAFDNLATNITICEIAMVVKSYVSIV